MAAISSLLIAGAAAVGVGSQIVSYTQAQKARKDQKAAEAAQLIKANNEASKQTVIGDTGAKVKLGTADTSSKKSSTSASRKGVVSNTIGGLGASDKLGI